MSFRWIPGDPFARLDRGSSGGSSRSHPAGRPPQPAIEETEFPAIDVFETAGELVVEAELPGVDPENIAVSAVENLIVIEGLKQEDPGPGRVNFLCMERSFGAFRRVVFTGAAVDLGRASAACRDGLLQVRVPKVAEKRGQARVIPLTPHTNGKRSQP